MMLKHRSEHHTKIQEYAQGLGERMAAIDRVTTRLTTEQNGELVTFTFTLFIQSFPTIEIR